MIDIDECDTIAWNQGIRPIGGNCRWWRRSRPID